MNRIAQFALAVSLLLAQSGPAKLVCACPPEPATARVATAVCPMSGVPGCRCCEGGDASDQEIQVPVATGGCLTAALPAGQSEQVQTPPLACDVPMVLLEQRVVQVTTPNLPVARAVTIAVFRIRPPNLGVHGLRAPPVCVS